VNIFAVSSDRGKRVGSSKRDGWRENKFTMNELSKAAAVCRVSRVIQPYVEMLA
jgi:hypothetical protein